jgi:hypothetical protein
MQDFWYALELASYWYHPSNCTPSAKPANLRDTISKRENSSGSFKKRRKDSSDQNGLLLKKELRPSQHPVLPVFAYLAGARVAFGNDNCEV